MKRSSSGSVPQIPLDVNSTHITKKFVDDAIEALAQLYPNIIEDLLRLERGEWDWFAAKSYEKAIAALVWETNIFAQHGLPKEELLCVELYFEIIRRIRQARGFALPTVLGVPLAPSIDGPYPDRLNPKPIYRKSILEVGFTQKLIDEWVAEYYRDHKQICYELGEAFRREVVHGFIYLKPGYSFFREKAEATNNPEFIKRYTAPLDELYARIRLTCEVISLDEIRTIQEKM